MNVRASLVPALVLALGLTGASNALAMPPAAPAATAVHAPTPPNPDKVLRPQTPAVAKTPTVSYHTALLAEKHDQLKHEPERPVPAKLRAAKQEVLERDQHVSDARVAFRAESATIAEKAAALAHPIQITHEKRYMTNSAGQTVLNRTYIEEQRREVPATPEALAQASEAYVSAAQLLVSKSGNLSQRVARENPDQGAKADAATAMARDYRDGAKLYRQSADTEDRRAAALTAAGKHPEAQIARDKAQNTRFVAGSFEKRAADIETKGVPGANAYTLPTELRLSPQ